MSTAENKKTFKIDPVHSHVGFSVRHLLSRLRGDFSTFGGEIEWDSENPENSKISASIDASSVDTRNGDRDAHLRSGDFLGVDENKQLTFVSKSVRSTGGSEYDIVGDLTIRGVTKEVVLKTEFFGTTKGMQGETLGAWEASVEIDRTDFGVAWHSAVEGVAVVGKKVKIELQIEAAA